MTDHPSDDTTLLRAEFSLDRVHLECKRIEREIGSLRMRLEALRSQVAYLKGHAPDAA